MTDEVKTAEFDYEALKKELFLETKHAGLRIEEEVNKNAEAFCEEYKLFLDKGKTEREAAEYAIEIAEAKGFVPFDRTKKYKAGDKVYYLNRNKSVAFVTYGTKSLDEGIRMSASHIDSPRLDLKPNPLYEDSDFAMFKTHYYGGVRKYQWVAIPLALHGVVCKKNGETVKISIGEKPEEPKFYMSDLLPHLAKDQAAKPLSQAIAGEDMNVFVGSMPVRDDKVTEKIKLNIMKLLNEKYGIVEADFLSAELEVVPAMNAGDVGFDRSMIGSYGHDDRVCAYTSFMAHMACETPVNTIMTVLADKEEIGSVGPTGLNSDYVKNFIGIMALSAGTDYYSVIEKSCCLSADVNAAFDPTWAAVYERRNTCMMNHGVVLTKYTGSGGKSGSNDSTAEFCGKMRRVFDEAGVIWQSGELGKVDQGGGGTVAAYIGGLGMDVVDMGVPVLSMHSPWELVSKLDVYMTFKAVEAFYGIASF